MSRHPEILWAQRSSATEDEKNVLFMTINLPDIDVSSLEYDLQPTALSFKAHAGTGVSKTEYEFKIDFYKEIIPDQSKKHLTSRSVVLTLRKKESEQEYWPRLTKDKVKNAYIKTDFSKWVDEDEQEGTDHATALEDDMGGMPGGMGGMGGMPGGMGGMGGMGIPGLGDMGMGGDNIDFSKMMPPTGTGGLDEDAPAPAPEGGLDSESDDDDDGPPPLE